MDFVEFLAKELSIPVEKLATLLKKYHCEKIRELWNELNWPPQHQRNSLRKHFGVNELEELDIFQLLLYRKHLSLIKQMELTKEEENNEGKDIGRKSDR